MVDGVNQVGPEKDQRNSHVEIEQELVGYEQMRVLVGSEDLTHSRSRDLGQRGRVEEVTADLVRATVRVGHPNRRNTHEHGGEEENKVEGSHPVRELLETAVETFANNDCAGEDEGNGGELVKPLSVFRGVQALLPQIEGSRIFNAFAGLCEFIFFPRNRSCCITNQC